jgi:type II secretory pathway pseudopilin PulG
MIREPTTSRRRGDRRSAGIALVEILVALSVLAIGFLSLVATLAQNARLQRLTHEKHLAILGAESVLEDLRRGEFRTLASRYGPSGSPGPDFDLVGLNPRSTDPDGHVGRISFLLDETASDPIAAAFELPRDLNGDGDALDVHVAADYRILPGRIVIEWAGAGGDSRIEVRALLIDSEDSE